MREQEALFAACARSRCYRGCECNAQALVYLYQRLVPMAVTGLMVIKSGFYILSTYAYHGVPAVINQSVLPA